MSQSRDEHRWIGKRVSKPDAWDKVTGRTQYLDDLVFPRMLVGKVLRSRLPHARIRHIDTGRALSLPGVKAIITAQDMPPHKIGFGYDHPPLKGDKVRCIGDEVAAVAAVDEDTALEALELIRVDYEELPALFDPLEAMQPGAALVHEDRESNISLTYNFAHGGPEEALEKAYAVVEERFVLPFITSCCLDTHGCLAFYDNAGKLTLWTPTQAPSIYHREMAEALGIPGAKIRVIKPAIGGAFGSKLDMYPFEVACAVLAEKTGQPVKIIFSREEEFIASHPRQPMIIDLKTGADREGRLTARVAKVVCDNGAYNCWGATSPMVGMQTVTSLYRVPHVRYDAYVVYTNNPYSGAIRGYGNPQTTFAVESQMDMLARKLGLDPLELRLKNVNRGEDVTPQKMKITSCGLEESLLKAGAGVGWHNSRPRKRGVGIAGYIHVGGGARIYRSDGCGATLKIDAMGKITLLTGATEMGQGSDAVLAQIVAEELGIGVENISVINTDTDVVPWDVGAHASRTTFIAGNAARRAAAEAKAQLLAAAAENLGVDPEKLEIKQGMVFVKEQQDRGIPYAKVVRSLHFRQGGKMITAQCFYDPPTEMLDDSWYGNVSAAYAFGAHAAEVEVDVETGKVQVLKLVCAHDIGKAINPMAVEGQIQGGAAMGLGYALTEELLVEKGRVRNPSFLDYRIFTAKDMITVEPIIVETGDSEGPFGAKGLGETSLIPTAAAIANAVEDAIGVRITSLPITPEKILRALRETAREG
ncbi:MAG: xanthine dehydrogenase family protein molybdopterin-binding subunit [Firmicutes bacterium]|nr:xanthine dehydrogenase family protein molybdopterin-binding subunit [Bacillota bacterium]